MSVTPTAPTPVSSLMIAASSPAVSRPIPRPRRRRVRSATLRARAEDIAATRSWSRWRSSTTIMKSAAPIGFAMTIAGAMARTISPDCGPDMK